MTQNQEYVEAGKVSEISNGHMKHVEINGKEIAIANLDGKFYAFSDRCGHMNARLSRGSINKNVVTCPFHDAKFDVTSGKKVGEPVLELPPGMEPLPPSWQKYMGTVGEEMSFIKTDDQEVFEVKVVGDSIKIKA
ncbi:MAG TPA: Rieske (2Fe-2S) protein [Nitrososphaeraceae archaeon]|nr:Rieske (2Fe-2S) protein [Nitrososphaeraceae archaeon]